MVRLRVSDRLVPETFTNETAEHPHLTQAKEYAKHIIQPILPHAFDHVYNFPSMPRKDQDVVEIPRPAGPSYSTTHAAPPRTFSSGGGFTAVNNHSKWPQNIVDLTSSSGRFGESEPTEYIDSAKANENIKALLEGAFEDEDDKPRTRGRRKQQVDSLTDKMRGLAVEEDDLEISDGTVEHLTVKLLPHQVEGLDWMLDRETGKPKKNGIRPKGGILADDVSSVALFGFNY
jgi:hypothetical protein